MAKYYTRSCNFYYGKLAYQLIKKKKALPLCGNKRIAFDKLEIFSRNIKSIKSSYFIHFEYEQIVKNINTRKRPKNISRSAFEKKVSFFIITINRLKNFDIFLK